MADHHALNPAERHDSEFRKRVVQWGEQQILKDYTLHINHPAQTGIWRGPSPLAVTYSQALLIYEALRDEYPDAFDVVGPSDRGGAPRAPSDDNRDEQPGPPNEQAGGMDTSTNGVHSRPHREGDAPSSRGSSPGPEEHPLPQSRSASDAPYAKTVHYEDASYEAINISREVVLTDDDWDGPHRPSLHVHEEGALLKMSGHPITEFTSTHALRTMAALFARAASEMERS